jgi:AAA+ ATPase superfamily predicted ATPase
VLRSKNSEIVATKSGKLVGLPMNSLSLHSHNECWGRDEELRWLADSVNSRTKAAVLLYGDSAIGKTTVIRKFCETFSEKKDVFVGFHGALSGDADPLLRCLNDILVKIYTVDHIKEQLAVACRQASAKFSLEGTRKFLIKILKLGEHAPGLGEFAKTAIKGFEIVADAVEGLDLKANEVKIGIDNFRDVLSILQTALPHAKFVFVIDNLNSAATSVMSEIPAASGFRTIESFLTQDFRGAQGVYFVFSWKRDPLNTKILDEFMLTFREYGGEAFYLKELKNQSDVERWLGNLFPWFNDLSDSQRDRMKQLSSGLPEIIVNWRDSELKEYNEETLTAIAKDIRERKYSRIRNQICAAPSAQRTILFSLALINQPTPIVVLVEMLGISYEECLKAVQRWCKGNLVLACTQSASKNTQNLYSYDHETKKIVALECLPSVLESPDKIAHLAYDFLLKTAQYDWLTLTGHLTTALELSNWVGIPAENGTFLKQLIEMIKTERPPVGQVNDWLFVNGVPPAIQAQYLGYSLHCQFGPTGRVISAAESWIRTLSNYDISSDKEARALALPLAHLCQHLWNTTNPLYIEFLTELRLLHQRFPENGELAGTYSIALAAGARVHVRDSIVRNTEAELSELKRRYPEISSIAESIALNLMYLAEHHRRSGKVELALECLSKLKDIDSEPRSSRRIAEIRSAAIFYLMSSEAKNTFDTSGFVAEERDIFRRFPKSTPIGSDFAGIIGHSASLSFENLDMLRERIIDLRNILSAHPGNSQIVKEIKRSLEMLRVVGMGTYMVDSGNDAVHTAISSEIRNLFEILGKHVDSSSPV